MSLLQSKEAEDARLTKQSVTEMTTANNSSWCYLRQRCYMGVFKYNLRGSLPQNVY